jgi:hypothetical protein
MLVQKSRKVLSSAITKADLQTARAQEEPTTQPKRKRTQKVGEEPSAKGGQRKYQVRDEDVIGAADSEVGRQVSTDSGARRPCGGKASMRGYH